MSFFKASPFGAPAAKASDSESDSDDEFFSRSKLTFARLSAAEADRKKRKAEQTANSREEPTSPDTPPSQKKQKTSARTDETPEAVSIDATSGEQNRSRSPTESPRAQSPVNESNAEPLPGNGTTNAAQEIIDLDDESDGSVEEVGSQPVPASQLSSDSANAKGPDAEPETAPTKQPESSAPPDPEANAIISILITSNIPETSALIVQRKLGQRLKEPRLAWCQRQAFDDRKSADVVLAWRGKQIYDSTTCRALGIGVDASGNIVGAGEGDSIGDTDRKIHMIATTREMMKQLRLAKVQPSNGLEDIVETQQPQPSEAKEKKVRVILKSRGRDDLKLMVKENHLVSRLINAFRKEHSIEDPSTQVSIHFDGEELEAESTIVDCGINDLDTIDVYEK